MSKVSTFRAYLTQSTSRLNAFSTSLVQLNGARRFSSTPVTAQKASTPALMYVPFRASELLSDVVLSL